MNEQIQHLLNDRKLDESQLKAHEIVYNPGRFCLSFPIKDEYGQSKGVLEYRPGQDPKYIYLLKQSNHPTFYNAEVLRKVFYGKPIFITEAPIDTLSLEKLGFLSVSSLSAKLNSAQMQILSRYTDKIILCFDNDIAGQKVAEKLMEAYGNDYGIYNFIVKGAKDPNDMLRSGQEESLKLQLDKFLEKI